MAPVCRHRVPRPRMRGAYAIYARTKLHAVPPIRYSYRCWRWTLGVGDRRRRRPADSVIACRRHATTTSCSSTRGKEECIAIRSTSFPCAFSGDERGMRRRRPRIHYSFFACQCASTHVSTHCLHSVRACVCNTHTSVRVPHATRHNATAFNMH